MLKRVLRKRTHLEQQEWEKMRKLMPRKGGTRGLQYEVLEFLFEHLYEKVTEEQLKEYLLTIREHLQPTGDPVKAAVNQAIKELQRLRTGAFELLKIQEVSLEGETKRYIQMNFRHFDTVVDFEQYQGYLQDVLSDEENLVLRSCFTVSPGRIAVPMKPLIFPGIEDRQLTRFRVQGLTNFFNSVPHLNSQMEYHFIPESYANFNFLLIYENETFEFPFLAIVSNIATVTSPEASQYIIYRGEKKLSKLKFLHQIWHTRRELAFEMKEMRAIQKEVALMAASIRKNHPEFDENILFQGMLVTKFRERWDHFKEKTTHERVEIGSGLFNS